MKEMLEGYARRQLRMIRGLLAIWALVSYGAALFSPSLNNIRFLGFPLGYYMAAQGAVVTFILLLFINARMMDRLDEEYLRRMKVDERAS